MIQQEKEARISSVIEEMKHLYPQALCALEWNGEPWKLLIMGCLSAQCTDARVNAVCRELFAVYPTPEAIAKAPLEELEKYIRPCGLYHVKAQNTKNACMLLTEQYNGTLPDTMEELLKFPGVGRKVANLLLGDIFHKGGIVADTHCIRICGRLGMYPENMKDPVKAEKIMNALVAPDERSDFCHRIVQFGRDVCSARAPKCQSCPLQALCEHRAAKNE